MESRDLLLAVLPGFLLRGGFDVLCGGAVGIERERRGKPAGFRTNILIGLGSTPYVLVGELLLEARSAPVDALEGGDGGAARAGHVEVGHHLEP
jgi:hypothetical protein